MVGLAYVDEARAASLVIEEEVIELDCKDCTSWKCFRWGARLGAGVANRDGKEEPAAEDGMETSYSDRIQSCGVKRVASELVEEVSVRPVRLVVGKAFPDPETSLVAGSFPVAG